MSFQVGQVYHLWCRACNPPKWKLHVLASIEPIPRFFLINSEPSAFQVKRAHLMASILELSGDSCGFLAHDSVLDCNELLGGYTAQELEDAANARPSAGRGRLDTSIRRAVRAIIANSRVLSQADKAMLLQLW